MDEHQHNPDRSPSEGWILELKDLSFSIGGLKITNRVSLRFKHHELRCIIGPNGAGKTGLFNLITGTYKPDDGRVFFEGEDITGIKPHAISRKGIVRKFQNPTIFDDLTVIDNLTLASLGNRKFKSMAFSNSIHQSKDQIEDILNRMHLSGREDELGANLSHGEKQWLEIGMVLARRPRLMLLDEPTAGMSPQETLQTAKIIKEISQGITTVVVEHDIKFLKDIGEHVTVLHLGAVLVEGTFEELENNPVVRDVYLGKRD
jgi:urea ABC transporter ATP-binding protein UrtD